MIIEEQEKTYLINFDNTTQITLATDKEEKEFAVMAETTKSKEIILGIYKTEERAREVLQEIIQSYKDYRTAECDGYTDVLQKTAVYEMPKE